MNKFMTFIGKIKGNEKAMFVCKIAFFYFIMMALWVYYLVSKDSAAPAFIYEAF